MDFILIRHPRVAVDEGVCYGASDVALHDDASRSAAQIAARLAALGAPAPGALVSSPLRRCAELADALAAASGGGLVARAHDSLAEIDFGKWEQQRWDAIDRAQLDLWAADFEHARPHGGESVAQFSARVQRWFFEFVDVESDSNAARGEGRTADALYAVTHAGVIRAVASLTLDVPLELCLRWSLNLPAIVWLTRRESSSGGEAASWTLRCWNA